MKLYNFHWKMCLWSLFIFQRYKTWFIIWTLNTEILSLHFKGGLLLTFLELFVKYLSFLSRIGKINQLWFDLDCSIATIDPLLYTCHTLGRIPEIIVINWTRLLYHNFFNTPSMWHSQHSCRGFLSPSQLGWRFQDNWIQRYWSKK